MKNEDIFEGAAPNGGMNVLLPCFVQHGQFIDALDLVPRQGRTVPCQLTQFLDCPSIRLGPVGHESNIGLSKVFHGQAV